MAWGFLESPGVLIHVWARGFLSSQLVCSEGGAENQVPRDDHSLPTCNPPPPLAAPPNCVGLKLGHPDPVELGQL